MSTDKSTKVRNMLKILENTGKKGDTNVKKYKPRIICINTFGQNNYIIKYLEVNAINLNNLPEEKEEKEKDEMD